MPTISGPLSTAIDTLRSMIAACATWQTWTDSANAADAQDHVYALGVLAYTPGVVYSVTTIKNKRPFVIVNLDLRDGFAFKEEGLGAYSDSGRLTMHFEDAIPDGTTDSTYQDVAFAFLNNLGDTLSELAEQGDEGGKLIINAIRTHSPILRVDPKLIDSLGDFHYATAIVEYGVQ